LELTIRRAGIPDVKLKYVDPMVVGGRLDPWLIALPPDASYSVAVPARKFSLTPHLTEEPFSAPVDLQLPLATREVGRANSDLQAISLIHVWVGTLTSDWVRFNAASGAGTFSLAAKREQDAIWSLRLRWTTLPTCRPQDGARATILARRQYA